MLAVLCVVLVVAGCPTPGPVTPQPDATDAALDDAGAPDDLDATTDDEARRKRDSAPPLDDCARAEATLVRLGCKDTRGQSLAMTKGGRPFADVCRASAAAGVALPATCIAVSTSCAKVLACGI